MSEQRLRDLFAASSTGRPKMDIVPPATGQIWRARWTDSDGEFACLVLLLGDVDTTERRVSVAAVSPRSESDRRTVTVTSDTDLRFNVWLDATSSIPVFVLDVRVADCDESDFDLVVDLLALPCLPASGESPLTKAGTAMIPATSITFNDDDTAWWVVPSAEHVFRLDRPCDTCGGDCEDGPNYHTPIAWHCRACIDGRHTFDIEVECCASRMKCNDQTKPHCAWGDGMDADGIRTYRVSVVPGMVEKQEDGTWRVQLKIHQ